MEGFFILAVVGVVIFKIVQFVRNERSREREFELDLKRPLIKRAVTPTRRVVEPDNEISVSEPVVFSRPPVPSEIEPPPLPPKKPEPEEPATAIAAIASEGAVETGELVVEDHEIAPEVFSERPPVEPEPPERLGILPEGEALDLHDAAQAIFLGEGGPYAATQRFQNRYDGRRLGGEGRLARVARFSNDRFFGRGPGIVVTVELEIRGGEEPVSAKTIRVLLALPEGTRDEMKSRIGQTLRVGGTALRCDVFSSKLYLVDPET